MAFPFRNILCPVDFDENSFGALDVATGLTRQNGGKVLHVVPTLVAPVGIRYVDLNKIQEEAAREKVKEIGDKQLAGLNYEY